MATTTQNYGLKKLEVTDMISVDPFNENFDKIDEKMKTNADAASAAQNTANGKITNAGGVSSARVLTQAEYNALSTKDANTVYFVKG